MAGRRGISSFSVLLIMAVTAVIGIACFSQLKVQYAPSVSDNSVTISYSYPGASSRILEAEVTSKLEGSLANIKEAKEIRSISDYGYGSIELVFRKKVDMETARFEVASQIRNIWSSLPDGCSYPSISVNSQGARSRVAMAFDVKSPLPSKEIAGFVEDYVLYPLSTIDGVSDVRFYGQTPYEWVITFDADKAMANGLSASEIRNAISIYYADEMVGVVQEGDNSFGVRLRNVTGTDFGSIPLKKVGGRVIHLGDIASFRYQEALPDSYYRINGLNTLEIAVGVSSDANLIAVVGAVKAKMAMMSEDFPDEISMSVSYDSSEYISDELDKIYFRTGLCLLILLLFVFVLNKSWRYMTVIAMTLGVNILASVTIYYLADLHIHIYTLAGITVSLGIIIDNSIVMIDHWTRHRDRGVFPALLSAVLTTVAALLVILLLPEKEKANLIDFSFVIIINLCVSLAVAYLFVPALLDYFPVRDDEKSVSVRKLRRIVKWNGRYERFIHWGVSHRWVFVLSFVLLFGIPTCLIPDEFGDEDIAPLKRYEKVLNKIVGWRPYAENKSSIDHLIGSSFALFNDAMSRSDFYREPTRPSLMIEAGMPEGCTVQQLDEVMSAMENYLAQFEEIETFETQISSYDEGVISVVFKPEFENTWIPHRIKNSVISMASDFGGANWVVTGLDDNYFNNNIVTDNKTNSIVLQGYNLDELLAYGEVLKGYLSKNRRVSDPEIWGGGYGDRPRTEFNVKYDGRALTARGTSPYSYYSALYSPLFCSVVVNMPKGGEYVDVRLESSSKDIMDAWHVDNVAVAVGDTKMKLSEVGSIEKGRTGLVIRRENQSYSISVNYNFIGSWQLSQKAMDDAIHYMKTVLPVGYSIESGEYRWFYENKDKYAGLILLVIALIFIICAVHFDSLRYPLAIIWLVPISFIGVFLVFGLTDFTFDKGGFAAFVILSGITVNAGIYLVSAWRQINGGYDPMKRYIKAFNRKIQPISLTVVSTILGLVPFLFDGPMEVFWFSFAIGTISGLVFSVIAFVLYLPVFCCKKG